MIRLGLRLSLGAGRAGLIRTVLMSSGAALGVLIMLACLASVSVAQAQQRRAEARSPVFIYNSAEPGGASAEPGGGSTELDGGSAESGGDSGVSGGDGAESGAAGGRSAAGIRLLEINDVIGDRPLRRIAVGGSTPDSPRPPGLAAFPAPGEVVVSPALLALIGSDPRATDRFPQRIVGTIGRAGLVAPDELRAYVGVPADDPYLAETNRRWQSFGGPMTYADGGQFSTDPNVYAAARGLALGLAVFVLVPLGVLLATCAQLSAAVRDRRLAALRLLGISAGQAARVNAIETGAVAAAGALLGVLLYAALGPLSEGWRVGRLRWYPADIDLPGAWIGAVVVLVVGFAVLVGVLATRDARVNPLAVRRNAPARRPNWWRAAPLAIVLGAALLAGFDTALAPLVRSVLFGIAWPAAGLALPLAVPLLAYAAAGLAERARRAPIWLALAGARIRHAPGGAHRLVAALAVAIYVAGFGALGTVLAANIPAIPVPADWNHEMPYQLTSHDKELTSALRQVDGIQVMDVDSVEATVGGHPSSIMVADCADFTEMFQLAAGESCVDGGSYRVDSTRLGDADAAPAGTKVTLKAGPRLTAPVATLHIVRMRHSTGGIGELLLTRSAAILGGKDPGDDKQIFVVAADRAAVDRAARLIAVRAPANALYGDVGIPAGFDEDLVATLLLAGMAASLVLGVASFVVAVADRAMERRRDTAALATVGVRPAVLALTEAAFAAIPLLLGVLLAVLSTVVMAVGLARVLRIGTVDVLRQLTALGWLGAGTVLIALLVIGVLARLTQRIGPEHLRRP